MIQKIGPVAYKLKLPEISLLHLVFMCPYTRRRVGKQVAVQQHPPITGIDEQTTNYTTEGNGQGEQWSGS